MRLISRMLKVGASPILLALITTGCATPGTSTNYYDGPNQDSSVSNQEVVSEGVDTTWDSLVDGLSGSFFVINNLSKESGLINLSFSSNSPETFVDCGETERTFEYKDESLQYEYQTAEDSSFKVASQRENGQTVVSSLNRSTQLEGRINVYVREESERRTLVRVNARYVFSVKMTGTNTLYALAGNPVDRTAVDPVTSELSFNTGAVGKANWGTPEDPVNVECVSTGKLEREVLEFLPR